VGRESGSAPWARQPKCQVFPRGGASLAHAQGKGKLAPGPRGTQVWKCALGKGKPVLMPRGAWVWLCALGKAASVQGQTTQVPGVPTWGRGLSSRSGQGQASPSAMWGSSVQEQVRPSARCPHVGARA